MWQAPEPVVVCADGSDAAFHAATWAIDEAANRDVPLRIVHVIETFDVDAEKSDAYSARLRSDTQYAESALRDTTAAVNATDLSVKLETEILWGSAESALINESSHAAMICLGAAGISPAARAPLSATADAVARNAQCPVAVIRMRSEPPPAGAGWILVGVENRADNEPVIEAAMEEARLRRLPVLAVDIRNHRLEDTGCDEFGNRIDKWSQCYPDVVIQPAKSPWGMPQGLAGGLCDRSDDFVELIVVGRIDDGARVGQIISSSSSSILVVH